MGGRTGARAWTRGAPLPTRHPFSPSENRYDCYYRHPFSPHCFHLLLSYPGGALPLSTLVHPCPPLCSLVNPCHLVFPHRPLSSPLCPQGPCPDLSVPGEGGGGGEGEEGEPSVEGAADCAFDLQYFDQMAERDEAVRLTLRRARR